jgi:hypothetical protein
MTIKKMVTVVRTFFNHETGDMSRYGTVMEESDDTKNIILKERKRDQEFVAEKLKRANISNIEYD